MSLIQKKNLLCFKLACFLFLSLVFSQTAHASKFWKSIHILDLRETEIATMHLQYNFQKYDHEYLQILIGAENAKKNNEFTLIHEEPASSGENELEFDLGSYIGQNIAVQFRLKKGSNPAKKQKPYNDLQITITTDANILKEVGRWSFDNNLLDSSGNDNHGVAQNGVDQYVNGFDGGQALVFDGNMYVDLNDNTSLSPLAFNWHEPFSISLWLKRSEKKPKRNIIGKINTSSKPKSGWVMFFQKQEVYFNLRYKPGKRVKAKTEGIPIPYDPELSGDFHHIVATYDGSGQSSGIHLYIDNTLNTHIVADDLNGKSTQSNLPSSNIGARDNNHGAGQPFKGLIDEVRIFQGELSPVDVECLYNNPITCDPIATSNVLVWGDGNWGEKNWSSKLLVTDLIWGQGNWGQRNWASQ